MSYSRVPTKFRELCIIKLMLVIHNDCSWQAKVANDRFLDEVISLSFTNMGKHFHFYPLCEVSLATSKNFFYVVAIEKGLRMSISH